MGRGDTWLNALLGAAVAIVLSFLPVSPAIGGGVAGYLQEGSRADGARVGALAGALAAIPIVLLFGLVGTFIFGAGLAGGFALPALGVGLLFVVLLLFAIAYSAGLGALGGYIAVAISEAD